MKLRGLQRLLLQTGLVSGPYLYPLDHHELLHQQLHLSCEVHRSLQHDKSMDRWEGCLDGRLTLNTQHLRYTEAMEGAVSIRSHFG